MLASAQTDIRIAVLVEAVKLMAGDTSEGKVDLGALGNCLRRTNPDFSPKRYGYSGLLDMLRTYDLLDVQREPGGHWSVRVRTGSGAINDAVDSTTVASA